MHPLVKGYAPLGEGFESTWTRGQEAPNLPPEPFLVPFEPFFLKNEPSDALRAQLHGLVELITSIPKGDKGDPGQNGNDGGPGPEGPPGPPFAQASTRQ
jgi:hypothetical protein